MASCKFPKLIVRPTTLTAFYKKSPIHATLISRTVLTVEAESLVVPWAAVLYDIHGTTWVYEKTAKTVFRRRRVLVRYTTDDLAVLAAGPKVGTEVVVDGAAELFGTEFGTGK